MKVSKKFVLPIWQLNKLYAIEVELKAKVREIPPVCEEYGKKFRPLFNFPSQMIIWSTLS